MSDSQRIFLELSQDMGFEIENGNLVTVIGGSDRKRMHQDIKNVGLDMKKVLSD